MHSTYLWYTVLQRSQKPFIEHWMRHTIIVWHKQWNRVSINSAPINNPKTIENKSAQAVYCVRARVRVCVAGQQKPEVHGISAVLTVNEELFDCFGQMQCNLANLWCMCYALDTTFQWGPSGCRESQSPHKWTNAIEHRLCVRMHSMYEDDPNVAMYIGVFQYCLHATNDITIIETTITVTTKLYQTTSNNKISFFFG